MMTLLDVLIDLNLQTILIFIAAFSFGYLYWNKSKQLNLPPGPPHVPVLGSIPWLGADMREPLLKLKKKYGDIMTVYIGSRCTVMLNTYELAKEAFAKHGHVFAGRPQDLFFITDITEGLGVVSAQEDRWKHQRRFIHTVLRDFGMGKSIIEDRIAEELGFFTERLDKLSTSRFDPRHTMMMAVANVICNVVWGHRGDYDDPLFMEYMQIMEANFEVLGSTGVLTAFPFLNKLPGDLFHYKKLMRTAQYMKDEFKKKIDEHKNTKDTHVNRDFIDAYLEKMKDEINNQETTFNEKQLIAVIGDLFGAGTETTTNTLLWAIIYMLHHEGVMKKVQKEIDNVIGKDKIVSMKDKQHLPYVEATILEVQRLSEVVPFGVPHSTLEDIEFHGYTIPKGTTIMANQYAIHRDEKHWNNPDQFNPDRFLDEHGKMLHKEQLMPFSIGKRSCLGEALARMELFMFFTTMLQRYDFKLAEGEKIPSLVGIFSITHVPPKFIIDITSRM